MRAAILACPDAVARGPTAARLHGFLAPAPGEPVYLLLPPGVDRHQRRGIVLRWSDPGEIVVVDGLPATSGERTLADMVLETRDRATAVSLMDEFTRSGAVRLDEARALTDRRRGCRRAAPWWDLADPRSESPLETRLRLLLTDHGLPPEDLQYVARDAYGWPIARLDLAYPSRKLDVEADGERFHSAPEALYRDRDRQNQLTAAGWTVLRFTWADVVQRPTAVVAAVAAVLARRAPSPRRS